MGIHDFIFGNNKKEKEARLEKEHQEKARKDSESITRIGTNHLANTIEEDARTTFFKLDEIRLRKMGDDFCVAPYDASWYSQFPDADVLPVLANTAEITRYLPGLDFSTKEKAQKALVGYMLQTEAQIGVTYVIRQRNFPAGMIFVHTPKYNARTMGVKIWTIDFFITSILEHKGVMKASLLRVMEQMKSAMGVSKVYALTEPDNKSCIGLLLNLDFKGIDNQGFRNTDDSKTNPLVFELDLSRIQFVER